MNETRLGIVYFHWASSFPCLIILYPKSINKIHENYVFLCDMKKIRKVKEASGETLLLLNYL